MPLPSVSFVSDAKDRRCDDVAAAVIGMPRASDIVRRRSAGFHLARRSLLAPGGRALRLVHAFGELLDHLPVEHRDVVGLAAVTRPWSVTTSRSTQSPPALPMSVRSDGHDVIVLPSRRRPRATSTAHDRSPRPVSPPRRSSARTGRPSTVIDSPQWSCSHPLIDPVFGDTTIVRAPAASSAFLGSVSSTRSTPSVANRDSLSL